MLNKKFIFGLSALAVTLMISGCTGSGSGESTEYTFSGDHLNLSTPPVKKEFIALENFQAASVVIGQPDFNTTEWATLPANAKNYSGSMYSNALIVNGNLYIGDEGFNRVLGYRAIPEVNGVAADFVLGQEDFTSSNNGDAANQMDAPHIGAYTEGKFFIVEYSGNRVLVYNTPPTETNASADFVIGQVDFGVEDNSTSNSCQVNKLGNAEAISAADGKLVIADSSQNRILIYNTIPTENNASADIVLGQSNFTSCEENRGGAAGADTLNYPAGIWTDGERLVVNDKDNNRVLIWNSFPTENGQEADIVLGQSDFNMTAANDDDQDGSSDSMPSNRTISGDEADSMNGLYSNGTQLFVADISNNRVLVWNEFPTSNFDPADIVIGQGDFNMNTPNDDDQDGSEDSQPSARTLSNPNGLYEKNNQLFIMDDYNARILIFNGQ